MKFAVFTDSTPEWTPEEATKTLAEKSELTQQRIKVLQELAWPGKKELKEEQ